LADRKKYDFLILDFVIGGHSNIEYHNLKKSGDVKTKVGTLTQIFMGRVSLLEKDLDEKQRN
jgi:type I restriction enzyme R subunit